MVGLPYNLSRDLIYRLTEPSKVTLFVSNISTWEFKAHNKIR